ncbi:formate/nitrite transporter family protein [Kocuria rhizosphaericola]|uniref:formate/nitrite transporter family protein n=1 Tax=Kocuria rhizosphaericola TaxID=3376284 RepID=UPI0037BC910D
MSAPDPDQIYDRAKEKGARRLFMPPLKQASTGFIAGVTTVFGIAAPPMAEELIAPQPRHRTGVVFLAIGRSELSTENFFDPVAAAINRREPSAWFRQGRLWALALVLNLVGGTVMAAIFPSRAHCCPGPRGSEDGRRGHRGQKRLSDVHPRHRRRHTADPALVSVARRRISHQPHHPGPPWLGSSTSWVPSTTSSSPCCTCSSVSGSVRPPPSRTWGWDCRMWR